MTSYSSTDGGDGVHSTVAGLNSPRIQVSLPAGSLRMPPPRSPSRESVATEISITSGSCYQPLADCWTSSSSKLPPHLSFLKSVPENLCCGQTQQQLSVSLTPNRGPSPTPGGGSRFLKVPGSSSLLGGVGSGMRSSSAISDCCWWEEETDLNVIKSCAALSKALGLQKSFSTGDIVSMTALDESANMSPDQQLPSGGGTCLMRACVSEVALSAVQLQCERMNPHFGMGSRSLSTWVAVGDGVAAVHQISSQLPSPQGRPTSVHVDNKTDVAAFASGGTTFTPADLILNLNKRVRQCYIRRRLLTTYKALERLSQSQFNLDRIAARADFVAVAAVSDTAVAAQSQQKPATLADASSSTTAATAALTLTLNDVERDQGRPLSKYMRNMMIFNWLHTLEDPTVQQQAEVL